VSRHVELGDDADPPVARVRDNLADLRLRVVQPVRSVALQPRVALALDPEPLVLGEMPVQHVQLHRGHPVERALDDRNGLEVPPGVHQEAAPDEPGRVFDAHRRDVEPRTVRRDELQ
jgi:hypothetical protein